MTLERLENLAKIGQIKAEAFAQADFEKLLASGKARLADALNQDLSFESRFDLAYNASHAIGLAALRRHGYRADNRYIVFQTLAHTLGLPAEKWRVLDQAHRMRNVAEYDGELDATEALVASMIGIAQEMVRRCEAPGKA
jgi:hypothetical protein